VSNHPSAISPKNIEPKPANQLNARPDKSKATEKIMELEGLKHRNARIAVTQLNEYAQAYLILGQYGKARDLLLHAEAGIPGMYQTISQLATLYQLLGKSEDAEQWQAKLLSIHPTSKDSSEWIAGQLLKLKSQANPENWLSRNEIEGLKFGMEKWPKYNLNKNYRILAWQIETQILEQQKYKSGFDIGISELYLALGNCYLLIHGPEAAIRQYERAIDQGNPKKLLIRKRIELANEIKTGKIKLKEKPEFKKLDTYLNQTKKSLKAFQDRMHKRENRVLNAEKERIKQANNPYILASTLKNPPPQPGNDEIPDSLFNNEKPATDTTENGNMNNSAVSNTLHTQTARRSGSSIWWWIGGISIVGAVIVYLYNRFFFNPIATNESEEESTTTVPPPAKRGNRPRNVD
jgi:hypothetical protein